LFRTIRTSIEEPRGAVRRRRGAASFRIGAVQPIPSAMDGRTLVNSLRWNERAANARVLPLDRGRDLVQAPLLDGSGPVAHTRVAFVDHHHAERGPRLRELLRSSRRSGSVRLDHEDVGAGLRSSVRRAAQTTGPSDEDPTSREQEPREVEKAPIAGSDHDSYVRRSAISHRGVRSANGGDENTAPRGDVACDQRMGSLDLSSRAAPNRLPAPRRGGAR
jgi:hypothetical protein